MSMMPSSGLRHTVWWSIHPSTWMEDSANFALTEFYEVAPGYATPHTRLRCVTRRGYESRPSGKGQPMAREEGFFDDLAIGLAKHLKSVIEGCHHHDTSG
jgi:hypothetical protein